MIIGSMLKKSNNNEFVGFPQETLQYLADLADNNTREWWHENKGRYEKYFLQPAFAFTNAMGAVLVRHIKGLSYEARVDRSIFRLNRDTRFSKGGAPYKTHIGIVFWKGPYADRHLNPGFYFQIEPQGLFLAAGAWMPTPEMLSEYRLALADKRRGAEFEKLMRALGKEGLKLNEDNKLKKAPKGFDPEHKLADYAKHKNFYVGMNDYFLSDIVHTRELLDYCEAFYSKCTGFVSWLAELACVAATNH
ncbi:hypothetical protein RsTz2092_05890 [Deferribacterales bacterium RsTz2092]|nr:hypothetical protein AGMMS49941_03480 [Deferribacterales bacterium]